MSDDHDNVQVDLEERYCPTCDQSFGADAIHCPDDGTKLVRLSPGVDPLLGRVIDTRFRIKKRVGAGGMGTVYLAFQGSVGRDVAVKVIESRLSQGRSAAKRFLREAKLASRLSQPNIVTVIDFGQTDDGLLYLVMELLKGRTLQQVLRDAGRFPIKRMVRVGVQLCDALEAAHGRSIIHRDLKPTNIVVLDEPGGRDYLKVLDFGLAKSLAGDDSHATVTQSDAILGTPGYISPEAVTGNPTDERTDLYSLGVILYELVAGRLPFSASNINVMIGKHANDPPEPLPDDVDPEVARLLLRLLEKRPQDRYQSASALRDDLMSLPDHVGDPMSTGTRRQLVRPEDASIGMDETLASGSNTDAATVATPRSSVSPRSSVDLDRPAQRSRLPWIGGGLLLAAVASLSVYFGWFAKADPGPATPGVEAAPADVADPAAATSADPADAASEPAATAEPAAASVDPGAVADPAGEEPSPKPRPVMRSRDDAAKKKVSKRSVDRNRSIERKRSAKKKKKKPAEKNKPVENKPAENNKPEKPPAIFDGD